MPAFWTETMPKPPDEPPDDNVLETTLTGRESAALARARRIARLLDQQFRLPGTSIRFGYDAILGLVPGVGDTLTAGISMYLVFEAIRLKIGAWPIFKMVVNVAVDWLVGLIPVADIFFDVAFKANVRNAKILTNALNKRRRA